MDYGTHDWLRNTESLLTIPPKKRNETKDKNTLTSWHLDKYGRSKHRKVATNNSK